MIIRPSLSGVFGLLAMKDARLMCKQRCAFFFTQIPNHLRMCDMFALLVHIVRSKTKLNRGVGILVF